MPEKCNRHADTSDNEIQVTPVKVTICSEGGDNYRCRLFGVPEHISRTDRAEHKPSYISIGPYHCRSKGLHVRSNQWKRDCKKHVIDRLESPKGEASLLEAMMEIEGEVRKYYDEIISSHVLHESGITFREMMVNDGCFLLITLQGLQVPGTDGIVWDNQLWWHDIFLYGNQLPFVVLRKIYQQLNLPADIENGQEDCPLGRISKVIESGLTSYTNRTVSNPGNADHILHLCHELLKPTSSAEMPPPPASDNQQVRVWRRATEYSELLVEFKKREFGSEPGDAQCISDVRIVGRVVEIPKLELQPETWRLLRNLMLLEETNKQLGGHVTAYCTFISQLASTPADVGLLTKKGILVHLENSDEMAAKKLSMLCEQIDYATEDYLIKSVWYKLDSHCSSRWWFWRAKLRRYRDWNNPLVWLGVLAAFVLFLCAILQAAYSMLAYYKQGSQSRST